MGAGDLMPIGGHRRKADPARVKKIKEGGKRADAIKKRMEDLHKKEEVPVAEEQLLKDLQQFNA